MVCWIKQENGSVVSLQDNWSHSIYVAAGDRSYKTITANKEIAPLIKNYEFARRREKITDAEKSTVLKLTLSDSSRAPALAGKIEKLGRFGQFRLYNVDVPPAQSYLYERSVFPLARCHVDTKDSGLSWRLKQHETVWSTEYELPEFKTIDLGVVAEKQGKIPRFTDRIRSISIGSENNDNVEISGKSELDLLDDLESEVARIDPDFIFTDGGDSFIFPYLIHRAGHNGTALFLGRGEKMPLVRPAKDGTSYFSYGRIYFKPSTIRLQGRIHVDRDNSFVLHEAKQYGLYEVARICRMPMHTAARASIGRCMSSLQFYHATKKGILIPWKPTLAEHFKPYNELLVADRGGFILEPETGAHEKVAEFDFASLYGNIMMKKNLSAETVRCSCCPDSTKRVPELGYNICKRKGITPMSLEILIKKRVEYKRKRDLEKNPGKRAMYNARQNAIKWILVTSFGYLGFNNAKFGRIDAHIAVCAFDRQVFLQACRIAERFGFRVLHGIVDSLWIQKRNATQDDYNELKEAIEQETGFEISFEGVYKWIAFAHSNSNYDLPVANRYFGVFEDGTIKIRGIEARRHDTPPLFARFQLEVLEILSKGGTIAEVKALLPEARRVFQRYADLLKEGDVPVGELMFTKQLSKDSDQHQSRNTVEGDALDQLLAEGKPLRAGETLQYVIADYGRMTKRTLPMELIASNASYDVKRYTELLAKVYNSVIEPFERNYV